MKPLLFLRYTFCACVLMLAAWRFSENTADPDLWGHVLFGQRMIHLGHLEKTEPFSWTAQGAEWINHEIGAELIMGAAHLALGGPGLLLLALATGFFTFLLALRMGSQDLPWPERAAAWAIAALAVKEIAYGFSVRPQIFSSVALILLFWILRQAHAGKLGWLLTLPGLFVLWINTHGGALAGFCLLFAVTAATGFQFLLHRFPRAQSWGLAEIPLRLAIVLNGVTALSLLALFVNPWQGELVRWLIGSVSWVRPEISEWNPPALGVEHVGFFALIPLSALAFAGSRRKRWLWEIAIIAALALIALRHARHIPLFAIAVLALVPPHLADAAVLWQKHFENLKAAWCRPLLPSALAGFFSAAFLVMAGATVSYQKDKFYTMEVPREVYPLTAMEFIRQHEIKGRMLAFFDWGEQCLWELPESSVSIDGRLDTCYSRDLLREHWSFYDGKPVDEKIFAFNQADFALLRTDVVGIATLKKNPAWKLVYADPLAEVWVRDWSRFPRLQKINLPVTHSREALRPREAFPSRPSLNATGTALAK